jgi:ATP-dependent DNA ligase
MLLTVKGRAFDDAGWIFELKYDGFRVFAIRHGKDMRLLSRRGNDLLPCFPELAAELRELPDLVIDGELVVLDDKGKPVFERVRRRARNRKPISAEAASRRDPAVMLAFDILSLRGKDLRKLPASQAEGHRSERATRLAAHSAGAVRGRARAAALRRRLRSTARGNRREARRLLVQGRGARRTG